MMGFIKIAIWLLVTGLTMLFLPVFTGTSLAANGVPEQNQSSFHASPWAFGQSEDRNAKIWKKGVDSDVIFKSNPQGKMAISDGRNAAREEVQKHKKRLGLSFKDERGAWKVAPDSPQMRPDELKLRDNRHVVRAFAGVEANDDLSFSVGPELILRDDSKGEESARMDQPDSAFGMGMNFKYDF